MVTTHRKGPTWRGSGWDSSQQQLRLLLPAPLPREGDLGRAAHSQGAANLLPSVSRSWQVNIIPIIAKADTISKSELHKFKIKIMGELVSNGVQIYQFPTDDEAVAEINAVMNVSVGRGPPVLGPTAGSPHRSLTEPRETLVPRIPALASAGKACGRLGPASPTSCGRGWEEWGTGLVLQLAQVWVAQGMESGWGPETCHREQAGCQRWELGGEPCPRVL